MSTIPMPDWGFFRRRRRPPAGLTCRELVELVTGYVEGSLSAADAARFERHISTCDGCTTYLEQMRETIAVLGALPPESLSPQAERALLDAFRSWKRERT
jgi:anti-sigma factor RsiW